MPPPTDPLEQSDTLITDNARCLASKTLGHMLCLQAPSSESVRAGRTSTAMAGISGLLYPGGDYTVSCVYGTTTDSALQTERVTIPRYTPTVLMGMDMAPPVVMAYTASSGAAGDPHSAPSTNSFAAKPPVAFDLKTGTFESSPTGSATEYVDQLWISWKVPPYSTPASRTPVEIRCREVYGARFSQWTWDRRWKVDTTAQLPSTLRSTPYRLDFDGQGSTDPTTPVPSRWVYTHSGRRVQTANKLWSDSHTADNLYDPRVKIHMPASTSGYDQVPCSGTTAANCFYRSSALWRTNVKPCSTYQCVVMWCNDPQQLQKCPPKQSGPCCVDLRSSGVSNSAPTACNGGISSPFISLAQLEGTNSTEFPLPEPRRGSLQSLARRYAFEQGATTVVQVLEAERQWWKNMEEDTKAFEADLEQELAMRRASGANFTGWTTGMGSGGVHQTPQQHALQPDTV